MANRLLLLAVFSSGVAVSTLVGRAGILLDEYTCGWERNYTTYPVRDAQNELVCMYRKQTYPYNIKGGVKA